MADSVEHHDHLLLWPGVADREFSSPEYAVAPFDRAVLSWNATGAADFELEVDGVKHTMGKWGERPESRKTAAVDIDTLVLKSPAKSFRFHLHPAPGARVTLAAVTYWISRERRPYSEIRSAAWGKVLEVPERSQMCETKDPGAICSPASVAMVLEYYGTKRTTREVADGVFDHAGKIYGNWPFNTAYAGRDGKFTAYVRRGSGIEDLEAEIAAGRPVIIGHGWRAGELDRAPIAESAGHLITIVGFSAQGDIVVNDPAGQPGSVRRVYNRRQIYETWLGRASGIMYMVRPNI